MFGHVLLHRAEQNKKTSKEELYGYPMRGTKMKLNYKRTIFVGFAFS